MTDKARKNLDKCKMDCFNCPFPDCVLPYSVSETTRSFINWTPEMDAVIIKGRENGETYSSLETKLGVSGQAIRKRYLKLKGKENIDGKEEKEKPKH